MGLLPSPTAGTWLISAAAVMSGGCRYGYEILGSNLQDDTDSMATGGDGGRGSDGNAGVGSGGVGSGGDPSIGTAGAGAGGTGGTTSALPSLVGYWKLDEGGGSRAVDSSDNANDGSLINFNTSGWTAGQIGGALSLNGSNTWVEVPASPSIDAISEKDTFTIAAWVYLETTDGLFRPILSQQKDTGNTETFGMFFNDGRLYLIINSDHRADHPDHTCRADVDALDRWVHVAGTFDGTTGRAYFEGSEVCEVTPADPILSKELNPIAIGGNVNDRDVLEIFRGALDEVALFDAALTQEQVTDLRDGTLLDL